MVSPVLRRIPTSPSTASTRLRECLTGRCLPNDPIWVRLCTGLCRTRDPPVLLAPTQVPDAHKHNCLVVSPASSHYSWAYLHPSSRRRLATEKKWYLLTCHVTLTRHGGTLESDWTRIQHQRTLAREMKVLVCRLFGVSCAPMGRSFHSWGGGSTARQVTTGMTHVPRKTIHEENA